MLFHIQDAQKAHVGAVFPQEDEAHAAELLRRAVGRRAAARLVALVGASTAVRLDTSDLVALGGVTRRDAERLVAARDYAHAVLTRKKKAATTADAVIAALPKGLAFAEVEMLFTVALAGNFTVKAVALVSKGGASDAVVMPRDVFLAAIRVAASALILVHNHPSGSEAPSDADVILTNTLAKIGIRLGIQVVDHIIVATGGTFSFQEHGLLPSTEELAQMLHEDAGLTGGAP